MDVESYIPRQLAAGSPIKKYGSPEGTAFPLVKGGVNTPTAKSACSALAMPPLFENFKKAMAGLLDRPGQRWAGRACALVYLRSRARALRSSC